MNDLLHARLAATERVARSAELADCGYDRHGVRALVRSGELIRVRSGAFVEAATWRAASAADRHVLTARAIVRPMPGYAVTHHTALGLWGLPLVSAGLDTVHLSRIGSGRARRAGSVRVHAPIRASDVATRLAVPVARVPVAVLATAEATWMRGAMRTALVAADAAVRTGLTSRAELVAEADARGCRFPGRRVAELASPLSESAGESWSRLVFDGLGLGQPEQQAEIRDERGRLVGRVDFLFRQERLIVEFDGAVKYEGVDGRSALVREKVREDALRALGYRVVRLTWSDLRHPERVLAKLGLG